MEERAQHAPWKVLLAVDGSQHALAACHLVRDLPLPPSSCLDIVSVLVPRNAAEHHGLLVEVLKQTQRMMDGKGWLIRTNLLTGYPAEMLLDYEQTYQPDLMVMGAKGLRGASQILLGGVVQQVVEYGSVPVYVARAPYSPLRRILLVVDESLHSQRAVDFVAGFPLPLNISVQVIHVLPPFPDRNLAAYSRTDEIGAAQLAEEDRAQKLQQAESEKQAGQALLAKALETLHAAGLVASSLLVRGDAATEILETARMEASDLIVAGGRGTRRDWRVLLGSVSRKLAHYATCSVLLVKAGQSQDSFARQ